ncbi:MAG TPA: phage tail sheath C-terminal domain-containing protein [Rhizomicrobium sp.]
MPVAVSYPGVYVEEIPSGVRTITGVATSIAAFVDFFPQGPIGPSNAVEVFSFADFQRQFGGLNTNSEASYAIQQFFLNGGGQAYVVRVTPASDKAAQAAATLGGGNLTVSAASPGGWGSNLRADVDYGLQVTADPVNSFNLTVTQYAGPTSSQVVAVEKYVNLVMDSTKPNDAAAMVNAASRLVQLAEPTGATARPSQTGTVSAALPLALPANKIGAGDKLSVSLSNSGGAVASGTITLPATPPTDYGTLASAIQSGLRAIQNGAVAAMPGATVSVVSDSQKVYLIAKPGLGDPSSSLTFNDVNPGISNAFLVFAAGDQQVALSGGDDGGTGSAADFGNALSGDPVAKTGLYALLDVDLFNILCIPATMNLAVTAANAVAADAIALCEQRRAMYIVDAPIAGAPDTPTGIQQWLAGNSQLRDRDAAVYFPRFQIADPLANYALRTVAPSGTIAGLYARTDANRGVWKAPAGTEANLANVQALNYKLTDGENGVLNPLAINCLRSFPVYGPICWGARTLYGADQMADDYKYIPVRRLALYIEESLFRGTQWVVFEPNAAPLWTQVRLNVGAFMQNLFRQGAFFGTTPQDAYFVTCDATNNPPDTINLGIINIAVGFAPLKPAEFVILQIQQMTALSAS